MKATDFSLPDENGKQHTLSAYKGKWVILYFYPKDDTPGCTKEACGFRDTLKSFTDQGVVILGVSKDSVASHKKFHDKFALTFPLLSDEDKKVITKYHTWGKKSFLGKSFEGVLRTTYLIDPTGEIRKVYEKVDPTIHAQQILADIQQLSS